MANFSLVWKSSATATATHLMSGGGGRVPRSRTPSSLNLRWRSDLVLSRCLKSITPLKPLQFQPQPQPQPKPKYAIWGIKEALKKSATVLLLMSVLLLSNPLSAQARISPVVRYAILLDAWKKSTMEDIKEEEDNSMGVGQKTAVLAFCLSLGALVALKTSFSGGGETTVLKLQFRYSSTAGSPLILELNRVNGFADRSTNAAGGDIGFYVNGLVRTLLPYQDHFISGHSFACVTKSFEEAHVMLTRLHVEQDAKLIEESLMDVTALGTSRFNKVYIVITIYMILEGYQELCTMNGSISLKDASDTMLSFPWSNIKSVHTKCKYWAEN